LRVVVGLPCVGHRYGCARRELVSRCRRRHLPDRGGPLGRRAPAVVVALGSAGAVVWWPSQKAAPGRDARCWPWIPAAPRALSGAGSWQERWCGWRPAGRRSRLTRRPAEGSACGV